MTVFLLLVAETLPTQSDSVPIIGRYTDISRYLWSYIESFIDSVTYTGGQPYGITTIKWHLREFDRYLLFLVVCSIAEDTLLISSIITQTKLNGQNSQYCLGTAETQEKEKCDFRGSHLKWSLPSHCHFDSFMQRGVSVKTIDISLKGIMPPKFATANTAANCQVVDRWQFSARSSQDAGGVSRMHKQKFCDATERLVDHIRGSVEVWRKSPRHGKTVNCSEWSEWTAQLLVCEYRCSADLGGGCQFEPFYDGFWPPDIGLGVQPDVLGSFWSTGVAVSGEGGTECGTSDNGVTASSVMSPGSPYTTVTVGPECAVGKGRGRGPSQ